MKPTDIEPTDQPSPPEPPPFARRLRAGWLQIVGVGLLTLLPIAALTGAFESEAEAGARNGDLELGVLYPNRMRHGTVATLEVRLANRGETPMADAVIHVPEEYLSNFADLRFMPGTMRLDDHGVQIAVGGLSPGQTRKLIVALKADRPGVHDGPISVSVSAGAGAAAQLEIRTLVLP